MLGPYETKSKGKVAYSGNKIFAPCKDILSHKFTVNSAKNRVTELQTKLYWPSIFRINHQINLSANKFFDKIGAQFVALPLITRMISSPGALYGKEKINYTTDTNPIKLNWFKLQKPVFLAESSQIYLELALSQPHLQQVYSIYNSFRKEKTDATHLSEFHHIEYEGKVCQKDNEKIASCLMGQILTTLLKKNDTDLAQFLTDEKLDDLKDLSSRLKANKISRLTFAEALEMLHEKTGENKYLKFTQKNFGVWEEVKLTELVGDMITIAEFPLLEVPFYHAQIDGKHPSVANNADIIWPGYIETVGTGHRVRSLDELIKKAELFNLPKDDYAPYIQTRLSPKYCETSGFGLGWERFLHGLLEMPCIWSASPFPRAHNTLKP